MVKTKYLLNLGILSAFMIIALFSCSDDPEVIMQEDPLDGIEAFLKPMSASSQRTGDPVLGEEYLLYGDYVDAGIPLNIYLSALGSDSENLLDRTGVNAEIAPGYTAITADNGVEVVAPNCMQCHAGEIDGQFILGLGNNLSNYTLDQTNLINLTDGLVINAYGQNSPEWNAYFPFSRASKAIGDQLITEVVGVNGADKLAVILAAHRDKDNLEWIDNPQFPIPEEVIPADVPAWWLLKKKNVMFSTGGGRGDFARLMMASSALTMKDSSVARSIDDNFVHVKAFLDNMEAPIYTASIDQVAAARGLEIFSDNCSLCHGNYETVENYPNLLVKHERLGTDSLLALSNYAYEDFTDWYNTSWFSKGSAGATFVGDDGYIAPPLDGIWATAPYLHNASVPTLRELIEVSTRPDVWRRTSNNNYDHDKLGFLYDTPASGATAGYYDTSKKGYGNEGHDFGQHLSSLEVDDLLEYLKTL